MEVDTRSDDGKMRHSPIKDTEDFSFSEDGEDTTDSLEIKPPQASQRSYKSNSSRRRDKHSGYSDRLDDRDRKPRHHDREDRRRENKHKHRRHGLESGSDTSVAKRDRERSDRSERLDNYSRSVVTSEREFSRHERKGRISEDRVLEDLRTRLLDKRRERRDDPRDVRDYKSESRRELRLEETREPRDRREIRESRIEDTRDKRDEVRAEERRQVRTEDSPYIDSELEQERPNREKRHKRSHKHDRVRDRDREREYREKQRETTMEVVEDEEDEPSPLSMPIKDPKELAEQELRKKRLLEADRELERRKEASKAELEARRLKRGEKRPHSPAPVYRLSDDDLSPIQSDDDQSKSSKQSSEDRHSSKDKSSEKQTSDSSDSSSEEEEEEDDDNDSTESNKGSNDESNDGSDYSNLSPISVDRLVKSDHSDGGSPGRIVSNGTAKEPEEVKEERFRLKLSDNGMELLCKMLTYDPAQRITAEDALQHPYFTESPLPIDPSMFPTWPAKSEAKDRSAIKVNASPKPPSGGKEYKQLGEYDEAELGPAVDGFHMGLMESGRRRTVPAGGGFHLKFCFSEEEAGDTADSLDIKPPQAALRLRKSTSSRRREKHGERRDRRDDKDRKSRHHDREDRRRENKHRHRRHGLESASDGSKRDRDRLERSERLDSHSRSAATSERESSRHERKERNTGDRVLEDLRTRNFVSRLLDKRRERRDDPRDLREYKPESRRELRLEESREPRDRRDMRMEDTRDRRGDMRMMMDDGRGGGGRMDDRRHLQSIDDPYPENELMEERSNRDKRHKRNHKYDRVRDRDRDKNDRERENRDKQMRESMMEGIQIHDIEELDLNDLPLQPKDIKELNEQEMRKERLLEADREMVRRKEVSRIELQARRLKRGEKRPHSPDHNHDQIVELTDDSLSPVQSDDDQSKSPNDRIWPGYSKLPVVSKIPFAQSYPVNNLRQRFSLKLSDNGIELLNKMLTYDPAQRMTAEDALQHTYFTETPLPIDPAMFPTWPAKSELGIRATTNASPKPPSGGKEYKQLGDNDDAEINASGGFHMGLMESGRGAAPVGGGFHLKFW
ncbi:Similar to Cdk11b: Cyclin-dependent kinase 11B (Mus musculus) [Cotesia congregata]|uniref:Similar to Cdk11b: Cyclin-dependent kinase 11B (Mus musculus) n=1 Tax=Cotesia congregata TaxID=51543 RepID=A0A8J2HU73_COTCN|nr:Similar to Cdk11b: Cyclin-dependent kinase 11B (Mus musculus) [Cotesia congregata]